ncbi:MAG: sigma-70 family RNA polymerase sigma factor [Saprospiraceae bacterium]|nr:sigma-70 family RNA polymerase sigma factor [Saprospiraceae bacterium]
MIEEKEILEKVRQHNRAAQKQLYYEFVKLVSSIANRYVTHTASSQDVVQTTFIKVFQNIGQYNAEKGSFKSWITKIAVNESLAILRKKDRTIFSSLEKNVDLSDSFVDEQVFASMELESVTQIINSLDEDDRIVLDLFFYEEYSHQEISEMLQISTQSSRVKLHRAKKSFIREWRKISGNEIQRTV